MLLLRLLLLLLLLRCDSALHGLVESADYAFAAADKGIEADDLLACLTALVTDRVAQTGEIAQSERRERDVRDGGLAGRRGMSRRMTMG